MQLDDLTIPSVLRKPNCRCRLIALEGVDGCGKSTICRKLGASSNDLAFVSIPREYIALPFKTYLSFQATHIANALIYAASLADRKTICDKLDPSVLFAVMDRSLWSTLSQSYAQYPEETKDILLMFEAVSPYIPIPEIVYVLDTPYDVCRERVMQRCAEDRKFDMMSREEYERHMEFYYWLEKQDVGVQLIRYNSRVSADESVRQINIQIRGDRV